MATGEAFFCKGVAPSNHKITIDPDKIEQTFVCHYSAIAASVSVDTGYDLPDNTVVERVWMRVFSAATASLIDVGTSSDRNGFIVELSAVTTGYRVMPMAVTAPTVSGSIGALLTMSATNAMANTMYLVNTAVSSIVYDNVTATSLAGTGYIFIKYYRQVA